MTDFYRIKFSISARDEMLVDFLGELIDCIRKWLENKYGALVSKTIQNWDVFNTGGMFGDEKGIGKFRVETISCKTNTHSPQNAWACKIVEFPLCNPQYIPRKWITEIGYQSISEKLAEISYSVRYEDLTEYSGRFLPKPAQNVPKIAQFLITSNKWICSINGSQIDTDIINYTAFDGELFGIDDCRDISDNNAQRSDKCSNIKDSNIIQIDNHWISLCTVNPPDKNKAVWMQRLADVVDGTLVAPIIDETKDAIFDNRTLIFRQDGPKDPDNIGFWEWTETQNEFGRWFSYATYIKNTTPIEIIILDKFSTIGEIVESLKSGLHIPEYVRCNILFAIKKEHLIEGVLCDLNNFNIRPGNDLFITIKNDIYTLPYYELNECDVFIWKHRKIYRKIYKYIALNEPKMRIPVCTLDETIKKMFLQRINWPVFKAQGISKKDWQKFKQFLSDIPKDTIHKALSEIYDMSLQDAQACVYSFLQTIEQYIDTEDVDSALIIKMIDNHEGLKQTCNEIAYKKWIEEHNAELESAREEVAKIREQSEKEVIIAKQRLLAAEKAISCAEEKRDGILSEITMFQSKLDQLITEIEQYDALGKNTLVAVRQRIADAQKDMAGFIADLSVFLPQCDSPSTVEKRVIEWKYACATDYSYSNADIDLAENWQDEFYTISQNLIYSARIDSELCQMLTAFLYAAHINNIPLLIAGPGGHDIAEALSASIYSIGAGQLTLCNECDYAVADEIKKYDERIVSIQNMFGKGWSDIFPQAFTKLKKHIVWTHPYIEDVAIEPKGLYNYMIPILSECFIGIGIVPVIEPLPGKRATNFKTYTTKKRQPLKISAFKRLGISRLLTQQLEVVLTDAKAITDSFAKDKDMEFLFGLLPLCVLTGRLDVLKDVVETESGISNFIKAEAERYIEKV